MANRCRRSSKRTAAANEQLMTTPNYAFERSARGLAAGAAGAWNIIAPAAPGAGIPRPAQRGR